MHKQIALNINGQFPNFKGQPHESVQEYLARGGQVRVFPYRYKEPETRLVWPTQYHADGTWLNHNWRKASE